MGDPDSLRKQLNLAMDFNNFVKFERILKDNPKFNVNHSTSDNGHFSFLHAACLTNRLEIVKVLLRHPDIKINGHSQCNSTPFGLACRDGHHEIVRLLLNDSRTSVNLPVQFGYTPLKVAADYGHLNVIQEAIASKRTDIKFGDKGRPGTKDTYLGGVLQAAHYHQHHEIISLMTDFEENPEQTRRHIRFKLGLDREEDAASVFAMTIFICDGLCALKEDVIWPQTTHLKIFGILKKLPMELQMVVCNRIAGLMNDIINKKHSEEAFRDLAKNLL